MSAPMWGNRIDRRCPCTRDCTGRSAECRKTCPEWAKYERIKQAEYAERERRKAEAELRNAPTAAQRSRAKKRERDKREGRF